MKRLCALLLSGALILTLCTGCTGLNLPSDAGNETNTSPETAEESSLREIRLTGESAEVTSGAKVRDSVVTVSAGGEYRVSGTLTEGQLVVDTGEEPMEVILHLDGVSIHNSADAAIYIRQAKNVTLYLEKGSENVLSSGSEETKSAFNGTQSGAVIYAEDDLKLRGDGSLTVEGMINNGIGCKDDFSLKDASVSITAVNNGLRVSENLHIGGGSLTVSAGKDGIKTTSAVKDGKGNVTVDAGSVAVSSGGDGISAEAALLISGGTVTVECEGKPELVSAKALKAKTELSITSGEVTLNSLDHCVHSTGSVSILGGSVTAVSAQGKSIAAHGDITVADGVLQLSSAKEGIETPTAFTLAGGELTILAGGDGIRVGEKGIGIGSGTGSLVLSGGTLHVGAAGKPVNSRGTLQLGGTQIEAAGSAKTLPMPVEGGSPAIICSMRVSAGETLRVSDKNGELLSFEVLGTGDCVVIASEALTAGSSYTLTCGSRKTTAMAV